MRRTTITGVLTLAALATVLTGCTSAAGPHVTVSATRPTGSSTAASATPTTSASDVRATASPSTSSSASAGAGTRKDPNAPAGQCADSRLAVSVQNDPTGSGAGQRLSYVVFRNTGDSTCELRGAPGVSLVGDGDGTQIGAAAARSTDGPTVSIPAGSYALAELTFPAIDKNGGAYGDGDGHDPKCQAKPVDGYRVYPPHSFRAYFSADKTYGCSTDLQALRVGSVEPASKFSYFHPAS